MPKGGKWKFIVFMLRLNPMTLHLSCESCTFFPHPQPTSMLYLFSAQIWMLTGDKLETATCIAKSSHLVSRNQDIHVFKPVCFNHTLSIPVLPCHHNGPN